jgi:hypothetical protein
MSRAAAGLALVIALAPLACTTGDDGSTHLSVILGNAGGDKDTYSLACDPPEGTVPNPRALCDALAEHSDTMLAEPDPVLCSAGHGTMYVDVRGTFRGDPVDRQVSGCQNPKGMQSWLLHLPFPPSPDAT